MFRTLRRLVRIAIAFSSLAVPTVALGQLDAIQNHCTLGGKQAIVSGLTSTNYDQGIIPGCTVTVYLTGTTTLATIYSNSTGTPLANPFTAVQNPSPNAGYWIFYAATGQGYDVKLSGGNGNPACTTAPNCYTTPLTYTDLKVGGGGGGNNFVAQVNGVNLQNPNEVNFVDSSTVTFTNPSGFVVQATAAGGGGCSSGGIPTTGGIVTGDNTSTNCGTNNRVSDTATTPANVQTFGYANLTDNNSTEVVALGSSNGATNISSESIWIGDTNGAIPTASPIADTNIGIGKQNFKSLQIPVGGGGYQENIAIGDSNFQNSEGDIQVFIGLGNGVDNLQSGSITNWSSNVIGIGESNAVDQENSSESVCIGDSNCNGATGDTAVQTDVVAIGDNNASKFNGVDLVAIGDNVGSTFAYNSYEIVSIGSSAANGVDDVSTVVHDVVAIGDGPSRKNSGNDIVSIGDLTLGGVNPSNVNTGSENVAIGELSLGVNYSGSQNVAIGGYAGAIGVVPPTTLGNGNTTGSQNTWIGYKSGPNTPTQLSNTIAIGYQAYNTASNQTVIGNSSVTSLLLYGCSTGQIAYDDGSGTCVTPQVSPLTAKGDIWVYGSSDTRLPVGTNNFVLTADSSQTTGLKWAAALTNPMTTLGDIIYGGASGTATRLAGNTTASTLCLVQTGTGSVSAAPVWAACSGSTATALSSVTAASTNATINSANNPIVWNWAQTTNSQTAFTFGENTAASGISDHMVDIKTSAGSTAIPLTVSDSLNGTQTIAALQVLPTWNTSGVVDAAVLVNVTNTASGAASKLLDLQVGGTPEFTVDKTGSVTNATWNGIVIAAGKGGTGVANTATLTLGSSNQNWATLGTGIVKNTTTTGAISDAASSDVISLWSGTCNSSSFLRGDGACASAGSGTPAFSSITSGTNTSAAMVIGTGASIAVSGSGTNAATSVGGITVSGTPSTGQVLTATSSSAANWQTVSTGSSVFSAITSGTNTSAAMVCGTGCSLGPTGTGSITATGMPWNGLTGSPPTFNQNTTGYAAGLAGGALGSLPYQSAANTTTFITSPTTSGHTFVPAWKPGGSAIAPVAMDLATYLASPPAIGGVASNTGTFSSIIVNGGGASSVQIGTNLFANIGSCTGGLEGSIAPVIDSTTATWGATISGGGSNHVLAYCDGSVWTVAAK